MRIINITHMYFLLAVIGISFMDASSVKPVNKWGEYQFYGEAFEATYAISANLLAEALAGKDSVNIVVKGMVSSVCQKKGCWMDMEIGENPNMKITFKDYGFFVPFDLKGKEAIIKGVAKKEKVDVETLRHYAKDAGKSNSEIKKINKEEEKIVFISSGVAYKPE